ncbi:MAG: aspartate--tRNA(Asn) ligase [Candidatus Levybacteria bacterium CG22_combo_CG10-13_8_21_14_all_35_11]|nr:MAG: aspartate--tRNA(Asn) ligase [Candidatus Levybacteria bacterium CG22_combo_CG10-13_8_21_14_all_35_11]
MLKRIFTSEVSMFVGEEVRLKGWLRLRRDHGKLIFLDLRDKDGIVQIVVTPKISESAYELAKDLRSEDVIEITGKVNKRPENAVNKDLDTGTVEMEATDIKILSKAETLPFDMGSDSLNLELPTLLDNRSLTLRHPQIAGIFKVQAALLKGFRKAAEDLGCVEIVVPTVVVDATEGGAELFQIDYYGRKAFLAQSPQLYKQIMVSIFERVYTIAHAYRAEPSVTTRHLSETTQMDIELGFVEFAELLDILENVAVEMIKYIEENCNKILKNSGTGKIAFGKIPRLTVREAQEIILKEFKRDNRKEKDLAPQDEVDICKWAKEKHISDFVTITHFPTMAKPFYTMPDPNNPEYSLSYDLLFRGVEVMSGSQRINDYNKLIENIKNRGMDPKKFEIYLQAFKYGMPVEGGFSFGMERITMKLLGLQNVREASLFPRDMERVDEKLSNFK